VRAELRRDSKAKRQQDPLVRSEQTPQAEMHRRSDRGNYRDNSIDVGKGWSGKYQNGAQLDSAGRCLSTENISELASLFIRASRRSGTEHVRGKCYRRNDTIGISARTEGFSRGSSNVVAGNHADFQPV